MTAIARFKHSPFRQFVPGADRVYAEHECTRIDAALGGDASLKFPIVDAEETASPTTTIAQIDWSSSSAVLHTESEPPSSATPQVALRCRQPLSVGESMRVNVPDVRFRCMFEVEAAPILAFLAEKVKESVWDFPLFDKCISSFSGMPTII